MLQKLTGSRVLVVDDSPLIAMMIEDFLTDLECRPYQSAHTATSALRAIETTAPDLVVLDLRVGAYQPDVQPADVLVTKRIPFVFVSGYPADMVPKRFKERPFVSKPFSTKELEAALSLAIGGGSEISMTSTLAHPARSERML